MKKLALATTVAFAAMTASVQAADVDRELGLIVSGVVDSWMGVQYIDDGVTDDTVFATGGEGLLSLPLGDNLSIQSDVKYETNDRAFEEAGLGDGLLGPRFSYQGAVHISWRDPMSGLFGAFGGMGTSNGYSVRGWDRFNYRFVGGEGQIYADDLTFYAQAGFIDYRVEPTSSGPVLATNPLDDGFFVRGVVRWFLDSSSRLQLEGTYLNADLESGAGNVDIFSLGARYDFTLPALPVVGDAPLYIAYRGTFRDSCFTSSLGGSDDLDVNDHTIMIGTSYSFSGDRVTVDRQGATLDTPDFNHNCLFAFSDRRLKTDISELGETDEGIKLYSWKYKSDLVTTWVGVMAQDLETTHPEALVTGSDGFYRVIYSKLDVRMMTLDQWNARYL